MSIDSTEGHYLKVMCDEIFGRSNFVSDITYEKSNVTGLGQGGAIFNTGEKLLVYKKETVELNEVLATEKLTKKTMQRYRKYIKSEGRRELVDEFESASNGLPVKIYKHTGYESGDISLKNFEARESEIRAQYYQFFVPTLFNRKMNSKMRLCHAWKRIVYILLNMCQVEVEMRENKPHCFTIMVNYVHG